MQTIDARTYNTPRTSRNAVKTAQPSSPISIKLVTIGMIAVSSVYLVTHVLASLGAF
jgi:hypothetical protein